MTLLRRSLLALFSLLTLSSLALAQVSYTGGSYTQNFDTLPSSGTYTFSGTGPFALDAAPFPTTTAPLAGWSFAKHTPATGNAVFQVSTGSANAGGAYSLGTAASGERALGLLGSGTNASRVGVRLINNTGATITEFTVAYTGEQWRRGSATANVLSFAYAVGADDISTGSFVNVSSLDFTAPLSSGTAGAVDGNNSANRVAITATVSAISWAPGASLVLRWSDVDNPGSDDTLAIDDLTFSTSNVPPEPIPPTVIATAPADNAVGVFPGTGITITFNAPATVTGTWFTIDGSVSGSHTATVLPAGSTYTLVPSPAFAEGETVTVNVIGAQITDAATGTATMAADYPFAFDTQSLAPLPIHTIQGSGTTSSYAGQPVSVEGIVTATFQGNPGLGGFYIQAPEAEYDADPATSEGIFVFNTTFPVSVGNRVRVAGTVTEYGTAPRTQTELASVTFVNVLSIGNPLPAPVAVTLPFASASAGEPYEGMRAVLPQTLTVSDASLLAQYGEVVLSTGRLPTPTNVVAPGAPAAAQLAANLLNQIIVDDGISTTYPDPTPYLADSGGLGATRRAGSTVTGATGIFDEKFGAYVLEPTAPVTFVDANPRSAPPTVGGTLKVAIGNVLNFFNGDGAGGGWAATQNDRGPHSQAEYDRQLAKVVAGIIAMAPDIMGLTEIENDRITNGLPTSYGPTSAIAVLVDALNVAAPAGTTYAFVDVGAADIVTDEIHCAFIYRVETVATVGAPAMLDHPAFSNVPPSAGIARNPLAQTFRQLSNGEKLTISINHFKSKGSVATGLGATNGLSPNPNNDQGDGQSRSNYVRKLQATALAAWLATDPTGSGDPDFLIIGDLNAYAKEDPMVILENAGYINLTEAAEGIGGYSYEFDGMYGHLDHALANDHLAGQVVDAVTWHVNSDEPAFYDYNLEGKTANQAAVNVGTAYRNADHDPVVVGLNLQPDPAVDVTAKLTITRPTPRQNPTTKRYVQAVMVKNTGGQPLAGPVTVILTQLSPNATLHNAAGFTTVVTPVNSPYFNLQVGSDGVLTAGETAVATIEFNNPTNQPITYTIKVVAGPGGR